MKSKYTVHTLLTIVTSYCGEISEMYTCPQTSGLAYQHKWFNECTSNAMSQNYYDYLTAIFILNISYSILVCNENNISL